MKGNFQGPDFTPCLRAGNGRSLLMCPSQDAREIRALLFKGTEEQILFSVSRGMYHFKDREQGA